MNILSFGGGVQTTALAILAAQGKVKVDAAIFADPGAEKPETYWYIEHYIKPLFKEAGIPFETITGELHGQSLYDYCFSRRLIPSLMNRWCSDKFKRRVIHNRYPQDGLLIGFSYDETNRAGRANNPQLVYPLIERGITSTDCRAIISNYGWPMPVKSACYFCVYARWQEWNWLKTTHPELVEKAVVLEANYHIRRPDLKETCGLFGGTPLWKFAQGIQSEMPILQEYSCWSGHCGH